MNKFNIVIVYISVQQTESCQHPVAHEGVLVNVGLGKCDLKSSLCRGYSLWTWPSPRIFPFLLCGRDAVLYMDISVFNTSNTDISLEFLRTTACLTKFWKSPREGQKSRIWAKEGQINEWAPWTSPLFLLSSWYLHVCQEQSQMRGFACFFRNGFSLCLMHSAASSDSHNFGLVFWIQRVHRVCDWSYSLPQWNFTPLIIPNAHIYRNLASQRGPAEDMRSGASCFGILVPIHLTLQNTLITS